MPAVIVAVDHQPGRNKTLDQAGIPRDVLAESVSNLDDTGRWPASAPASTGYPQAVFTREVKLVRLDCSGIHVRHRKRGGTPAWAADLSAGGPT